jgi:hypothetical protein
MHPEIGWIRICPFMFGRMAENRFSRLREQFLLPPAAASGCAAGAGRTAAAARRHPSELRRRTRCIMG